MRDDDKITEHPSFGQIVINRVTSTVGVTFYGSALKSRNFIELALKESELIRSLNEDRYHDGKTIVKVRMTENQFAQMITTLNMGGGTPCTIVRREVKGKLVLVEDPPLDNERTKIEEEFKSKAQETVSDLEDALQALNALAAPGAKMTKAAILEAQQKVEKAVREIGSNMPFVVKQFQRTMDNVVTAAKGEIEAHMMNAVMRAKALGVTETGISPNMIETSEK